MANTAATRSGATRTEKLFRVAIALKGIDGAWQLLAGIVLLFVPPGAMTELADWVATRDLLGDPAGSLSAHLQMAAHNFADGSTRWFAVAYLLIHGVIKLGLVYALLRKIAPAYPLAVVALAAFVVFEVLHAVHTHSVALPIFAALDIVIIVLVIKEYLQLRRERASAQGSQISREPSSH